MADLHKYDDRESWTDWAIEFMRRGLWLDDNITVHGPHNAPADRMWGEAEASLDGIRCGYELYFCTASKSRGIHDFRGLRIVERNVPARDRTRFPVMKVSELTPKARRWLKAARRLQKKYAAENREASRVYREELAAFRAAGN
jgi:hypothetical protein